MTRTIYLILCTCLLGCQQPTDTAKNHGAQQGGIPALQLAYTLPGTPVFTLDSMRGVVIPEPAPPGQDSPAWIWEESQRVAVWGSLENYRWVYPLTQELPESLARATYALASDMWLVSASNLTQVTNWPSTSPNSALFVPAQSAECPSHALSYNRLLGDERIVASADAPLMSRGTFGSYLVHQLLDGSTRLVSSACTSVVGPWSSALDAPYDAPVNNDWRYQRTADWLLQTVLSHRLGDTTLIEAPEVLQDLEDLAIRPPLCQSINAPPQDSVKIQLYSPESFVLQVLAKLPVALRQQLSGPWHDVLQSPAGQEWLQHFKPRSGDIDSGMQSLLQCNSHAGTILALAEDLANLRTSTKDKWVSKHTNQLRHVAFENRLLEATQLLNEAAWRYEKLSSSHPAYRFHRKRRRSSELIRFQLAFFDGRQSLSTQTVPGTDVVLFNTAALFGGLTRTYEQAEYLVNLDAARIVDMLDERQAVLLQAGVPPTGDGPQNALKTATRIKRQKDGALFRHPSWPVALADAVVTEFDRSPLADTYELRVRGVASPSAELHFYLAFLDPSAVLSGAPRGGPRHIPGPGRARKAWRDLLISRGAGKRSRVHMAVATVEGADGSNRKQEFEQELYGIVLACQNQLGTHVNLHDYVTLKTISHSSRDGLIYELSVDFKWFRTDTGIDFDTVFTTCLPLVEDES